MQTEKEKTDKTVLILFYLFLALIIEKYILIIIVI